MKTTKQLRNQDWKSRTEYRCAFTLHTNDWVLANHTITMEFIQYLRDHNIIGYGSFMTAPHVTGPQIFSKTAAAAEACEEGLKAICERYGVMVTGSVVPA